MSEAPPGRAVIAETRTETPHLHLLRLGLDGSQEALFHAYRHPGQYVRVETADESAGIFALANPPGDAGFELLLKRGGKLADKLAELPVGDPLVVSAPQGPGFPLGEARGRDLYLCAVGSGIAPIRAVIGAVLADRAAFGQVRLYEGQRTAADFAFARERPAWRAADIALIEVASQPIGDWPGAVGYVQAALRAERRDASNAVAFLCGMKAMVEGVREALSELGLPRERTYLNY